MTAIGDDNRQILQRASQIMAHSDMGRGSETPPAGALDIAHVGAVTPVADAVLP